MTFCELFEFPFSGSTAYHLHNYISVAIMNTVFESHTVEPTCPVPRQIPMKSLNLLGNINRNAMFTVRVSFHESLRFVVIQLETPTRYFSLGMKAQ